MSIFLTRFSDHILHNIGLHISDACLRDFGAIFAKICPFFELPKFFFFFFNMIWYYFRNIILSRFINIFLYFYYIRVINIFILPFHDGGRYHIETSPLRQYQ